MKEWYIDKDGHMIIRGKMIAYRPKVEPVEIETGSRHNPDTTRFAGYGIQLPRDKKK